MTLKGAASLALVSPMRGWVGPLDEAPDAVFAQRMLGDGVAIDPTGSTLHAPCAGRVISVHHTRHAVSLLAENGAEILIHIGLETVALGGVGFEVHVVDGQSVAAGDLLISFDLEVLASRATSLLTPIIVTNGDAFAIARRAQNRETEVGDWLMEIVAVADRVAEVAAGSAGEASAQFVVGLAHGLHARPAAAIANLAKQFDATVEMNFADKRGNAKSPIAIMALGLRHGDAANVVGRGIDAEAAVASLVALIQTGLSDEPTSVPPAVPIAPVSREAADGVLIGVSAAPGLAIGVAVRVDRRIAEVSSVGAGVEAEARSLTAALTAVRVRLEGFATTGSTEQRTIMAAHLALLEDPDIAAASAAAINAGASAGVAWRAALAPQIASLQALPDARMAARADDLLDLEYQVIAVLSGETKAAELPENAILLADDLLPSQLIAFDAARIAGICIARGGPTSHVAIIAAAMNVPAVVAVGPAVLAIADGTVLVLDGDAARLDVAPLPSVIDSARARLATRHERRSFALATAHDDCRMADGTRIEVFANLGGIGDARAAAAAGAEGCGLLRTELLFLDRTTPPSVDEQLAEYQAIATTLAGLPLIIRTLDVGGDKPVAYLDIPPEDNPALGLRGIRVGLWQPDLLRAQIRAILRVAPVGQCRIMLPMVASVSELTKVRVIVDAIRTELGITAPIELGVMIETPAAAVTADLLAGHADFFSIGTNDLAQYALAMDRGNPLLAPLIDGLHPAVLRLIEQAVHGAATADRPVGICGGLASDLVATPILLGLGITELSAVPAIIPELKALIRTLHPGACRELAGRALAQTSAENVRGLRVDWGTMP